MTRPYTLKEFREDKLLVAKVLAKGKHREARAFLQDINMVSVDNPVIYNQTTGMLFVLEILHPETLREK